MKILVVTSRNFWPVDGGHEYVLYNYFEKLNRNYNVLIDVITFGDKSNNIPSFINNVFYLKRKSNFKFLFQIIPYFLNKKISLQTRMFYDKKNEKIINDIIKSGNYNSVFYDLIRMSKYAENNNYTKKIFNAEDLFSKRYSIMYNEKKYENALGQLNNNKFFKFFSKIPFLMKLILKKEILRVENEERESVKNFDSIMFVSNSEANEFNNRYSTNIALEITIGVDKPKHNYTDYEHNDDISMSIIGNFTVAANKDSLIYIIENILPQLDKSYVFNIVGKVDSELQKKYQNSQVVFHGYVSDPEEIICKSNLFLSPILYGTGIKTKILQALSLGMPIITNYYGITGLSENVKKFIHYYEDFSGYGKLIENVINQVDLNKEKSHEISKYIFEHNNWEKIIEQLKNMLE